MLNSHDSNPSHSSTENSRDGPENSAKPAHYDLLAKAQNTDRWYIVRLIMLCLVAGLIINHTQVDHDISLAALGLVSLWSTVITFAVGCMTNGTASHAVRLVAEHRRVLRNVIDPYQSSMGLGSDVEDALRVLPASAASLKRSMKLGFLLVALAVGLSGYTFADTVLTYGIEALNLYAIVAIASSSTAIIIAGLAVWQIATALQRCADVEDSANGYLHECIAAFMKYFENERSIRDSFLRRVNVRPQPESILD